MPTEPVHYLLPGDHFQIGAKTDLGDDPRVICTMCETVLCIVEGGDDLTVLLGVAVDHYAKGCVPARSGWDVDIPDDAEITPRAIAALRAAQERGR
jgi:hypothetical protein